MAVLQPCISAAFLRAACNTWACIAYATTGLRIKFGSASAKAPTFSATHMPCACCCRLGPCGRRGLLLQSLHSLHVPDLAPVLRRPRCQQQHPKRL